MWISVVLLLLFIVCAAVWGAIDGRSDATANRDPDRRQDLAMTWLLAGLFAGILSGAVSWLISLFYKGLYTGGLINEVTTFAAFTALCVFLPGIIGVAVGRWRVDRTGAYKPQGGAGGRQEDRADTDVFAAVHSDEAAAEGGARPQEQPSAVATAEREEYGAPAYSAEGEETAEAVSPAHSEEKTGKIHWPPPQSAEATEVIPTHETEHIEPSAKRDED